jgi:hypothetical protein
MFRLPHSSGTMEVSGWSAGQASAAAVGIGIPRHGLTAWLKPTRRWRMSSYRTRRVIRAASKPMVKRHSKSRGCRGNAPPPVAKGATRQHEGFEPDVRSGRGRGLCGGSRLPILEATRLPEVHWKEVTWTTNAKTG